MELTHAYEEMAPESVRQTRTRMGPAFAWFDMRDTCQMLAHVHNAEIEIGDGYSRWINRCINGSKNRQLSRRNRAAVAPSPSGTAPESAKGLPVYSIDHEVGSLIRPLPRHSSHFAG